MSTFSNVLQDNRKAVNKSIGGHTDASKIALDSSRERTNGIIIKRVWNCQLLIHLE